MGKISGVASFRPLAVFVWRIFDCYWGSLEDQESHVMLPVTPVYLMTWKHASLIRRKNILKIEMGNFVGIVALFKF